EHYPIVADYYDPKFYFPGKVRTFCTNSGNAFVVQERYETEHKEVYHSVNGHAFSKKRGQGNGLVNFAMLKTVRLTEPLASGQQFAEILGLQAMLLGGGKPLRQRVGDFRLGKRSKEDTFNADLYDFEPTLRSSCPGDVSLAVPAKILRDIWKSMKLLDTIVPGVLHPSTIMYYPEIKLYANKPGYLDRHFQVVEHVYFAGDGAGTSRGITAAWASGIRAAEGILSSLS
ncbi:MAG TPA: pyridine nucleotide-disulfide oxidoreductase, partial [Sediminispirochaeta sp.]|nr:pyridine nucleotide-disulfide oxidoreductase [Sediminispirochaeta sp.]